MNLSQLTEQQKKIALAALVIVAAVSLGYVLGKKPAPTNNELVDQETTTNGLSTSETANNTPTTKTGGTKTTTQPTATDTKNSEEPVAAPAKKGSISLAAKSGNGGVSFSWTLPGNLTVPFGYYIFKSTGSSPSFPRDEAKYVADPGARSFTWDIQDGKTYWFKMCTWNGKTASQSGCLTSSNTVKAIAPTAQASQTENPFDYTAIELGLAGRTESDGVRLFWSQTTSTAFTGYKIVRSATDTNPYYPKTPAVITLQNKTDVGGFDTTATKGTKYWYRACITRTNLNPQCGNVWTVQY